MPEDPIPPDPVVKVKMPNSPPYEGALVQQDDLIWVTEKSTGILKKATINQLPFGSGSGEGGGDVTLSGSPFKVRTSDDQVQIIGANTVISDLRLLGKTDYFLSSSQLQNGGGFRDNEITYDADNGKVTIKDFILLSGEFITLFPDGIQAQGEGSGEGSLAPLIERIEELERMTAPFKPGVSGPGGGAILFMQEVNKIPVGWEPVPELQGKFAIGRDPNVTEFNSVTKSGGSRTKKLTMNNIPEHFVYTVIAEDVNSNNFPYELGREPGNLRSIVKSWYKGSGGGRESYHLMGGNADFPGIQPNVSPSSKVGKSDPDAIDFTNPYQVVDFIRYIGVAP